MFLELDGDGPAYAQIIRALKAAILDGRLTSGTKLSSTRLLADNLGVSRITVLTAYEQLRAEGYIVCRAGSGCRVNDLQVFPGLPASDPKHIEPQSRYASRTRAWRDGHRRMGIEHTGVRFDLHYGGATTNPALNAAWGRELARAAKYTRREHMRTQGWMALREQICIYLAQRRGVRTQPDDVLITNGSQQAIALTARVLLEEQDTVAVEEPHYFGIWRTFAAHGAKLRPVRVDSEGLVCSALPKHAPKLVCVTPSHQFPSGPVLSLRRRLELLRYAEATNCWVLEDDYDSEFRYDSKPLAALRSLDNGHRVIYIGTFSKLMFGWMRLGYMVVPGALRQDFVNAKYLCDFCAPAIDQAALAHFMQTGGFERHLRQAGKTLRSRREVLIEELHRNAGDRVRVSDSHAGMHIVAWLPGYDYPRLDALIDYAHGRGLGLYPMAPHYHTRPRVPGLLLGYGGLSVKELSQAMRLFGECLDAIGASPTARKYHARAPQRALTRPR